MFREEDHKRVPKGSPEGGRFTKSSESSDGAGGIHVATSAEEKRLKELGINHKQQSDKIELSKKNYAEVCSAIRTKYADKIPTKGQIFYGDDYYRFKYDKRQARIIFTFKLQIADNEDMINYYWREFGNE